MSFLYLLHFLYLSISLSHSIFFLSPYIFISHYIWLYILYLSISFYTSLYLFLSQYISTFLSISHYNEVPCGWAQRQLGTISCSAQRQLNTIWLCPERITYSIIVSPYIPYISSHLAISPHITISVYMSLHLPLSIHISYIWLYLPISVSPIFPYISLYLSLYLHIPLHIFICHYVWLHPLYLSISFCTSLYLFLSHYISTPISHDNWVPCGWAQIQLGTIWLRPKTINYHIPVPRANYVHCTISLNLLVSFTFPQILLCLPVDFNLCLYVLISTSFYAYLLSLFISPYISPCISYISYISYISSYLPNRPGHVSSYLTISDYIPYISVYLLYLTIYLSISLYLHNIYT